MLPVRQQVVKTSAEPDVRAGDAVVKLRCSAELRRLLVVQRRWNFWKARLCCDRQKSLMQPSH